VDIGSGIDDVGTPAPTTTLAPVTQPTATPTPLGALGKAIKVPDSPMYLAVLDNNVRPYVLRSASLIGLNGSDQIAGVYTQGIGQPKGLAAGGLLDLWALSASPPQVAHWQLGPGGLSLAGTVPAPATPSCVAVRGGEVWVGSEGGVLLRIGSDGATASFSGFGAASAIALGSDAAWVTSAAGEVFKVSRATGAPLARLAAGSRPIGVAIDPTGAVWTADQGSATATRVAADGATASFALGATPSAIVADARRIWFALPGKLAYYKPDGTKEGEAAVKLSDLPMDPPTPLAIDALALDSDGRIWVLDRQRETLVPVWGKRPGE
jgi:DNA-binding beta-propeller fold protein YncE